MSQWLSAVQPISFSHANLPKYEAVVEIIEATPPLKVCLVLKDRGWILEKMAMRLAEHLPQWNVEADIARFPSPTVDVNHWMLYYDLEGRRYGRNTLSITHVDRPAKLHLLRHRLKSAELGICMSRMAVERLVLAGIPRQRLCYITPAHDGTVKPKRIVIGITSQIRPDGAKREHVLIQMAQAIRLDAFHFDIIGPNWEGVIPYFKAAGATVDYESGLYRKDNTAHLRLVQEHLMRFDYYLYMGWDEGSMGFLDALAAGIPTIVTPQGFHLDVVDGITFSFSDAADLSAIFQRLAGERQRRIDSVSRLTWREYARQHAIVWRGLMDGQYNRGNASASLQDPELPPLPMLTGRQPLASDDVHGQRNLAAHREDFLLLWELYTGKKFQETKLFHVARAVKRFVVGTRA